MTDDMHFTLEDRESMLNLGHELYKRVSFGLKMKGNALGVSAEIMSDLASLSSIVSENLDIQSLKMLDCNGPEVQAVVSLYTLKEYIPTLRILDLTPLALANLGRRDSRFIITELWTLKALTAEAIRSTRELVAMFRQ